LTSGFKRAAVRRREGQERGTVAGGATDSGKKRSLERMKKKSVQRKKALLKTDVHVEVGGGEMAPPGRRRGVRNCVNDNGRGTSMTGTAVQRKS